MTKIFTVAMPDIGEGVIEGEVIQWLKNIGDPLTQDEPVVTVMTDKATVELPAPYPGKLAKQYYPVGGIAIKDKPLYDIEINNEVLAESKEQATTHTHSVNPSQNNLTKIKSSSAVTKALAAPATRKLAQELGIDIDQLTGTGPEGRVTHADVARANASVQHKSQTTSLLRLPGDIEEPIIGIRKLMSKRMTEAHGNIPQFAFFEQLDATRLIQLRHHFKVAAAKEGISATYMPFFIKALSMTLKQKQYTLVNSSVDSESNVMIIHKQHNVGIAIASEGGLIVPVLKNVEEMSLEEVVRAYDVLRSKALNNKLQPSDMRESTITISNFGVLGDAGGGGLWATPIVNYPEVAILGIGRIHKQPVVRNDEVVIRDMLNLSWGFDHRIIDGDLAAGFSHYFSSLLQNPAALI